MLAKVHRLTGGRIPLIGIGGIESGETALAKIEAGATLIQLYTALVYEGPGLIERIKEHLVAVMAAEGGTNLAPLVGRRVDEWADRPLPEGG
jgi:dihydroorotate dehydrogenase